jgi:ferredoxin-NADP reductase/MOSC domain-containing protein YiiM/ferredoxin
MARRLNLDGDGQGDLAGHGGEHRAVMVYQMDSYRYWEKLLQRGDFQYGQFGENLTIEGLPDDEVCIGNRYRIGGALFEVTQPRVTCYRVGIRMNNPQMPALLVSHKRPGFYLRVLEEGEVGAGDEIVKVADGPEQVTVAEVDALLYLPGHPRDRLQSALCVPALSAGWKASLEALVAADSHEGNAGLAPSTAPPPAWAGFRPFRVADIHQESADVLSFFFEAQDGTSLPSALPGQFLVFRFRLSDGSDAMLRSYSISGFQRPGRFRVSVKRGTGVGSRYWHDRMKIGDRIEVSAPRGSFTLAADDNPVVFLSAGIGATPVLSMLHSLAEGSEPSTRDVWWCYGARSAQEHPFAAEVRDCLARLPHSHSFIAYSKPEEGDQQGRDFDFAGHLDLASLQRLPVPQTADFYLCGPPSFLEEFTDGLKTWGVPSSRIHSEMFGGETALTPGIASAPAPPPHPPVGPAGTGPEVSFTRSGLTVPWDRRFGSILEFAEACDVPVRWSCRAGVCHNCESGLIDGKISYAPEPLDRPAEGNILICCSTPLSAVELDL